MTKTKRLRWPYWVGVEGGEWILKRRRLFRQAETICRARTWDAMKFALEEQSFTL